MFVAISQDRARAATAKRRTWPAAACWASNRTALEALVANVVDIAPPKVRDIVVFGLKCARNPQGLTEADFEGLRRHGLAQSEIMEVIAMAALAVYANTIADATGHAARRHVHAVP